MTPCTSGWFYMDENQGMLTGWQFINGKWYYLNSNQRRQCRHHVFKTPDTGRLVRERRRQLG